MAQIIYMLAELLALVRWQSLHSMALAWLVAGLCIASGVDYVLRWGRRAWLARHLQQLR